MAELERNAGKRYVENGKWKRHPTLEQLRAEVNLLNKIFIFIFFFFSCLTWKFFFDSYSSHR